MDIRQAFAMALRTARKAKGLTQEDFANVSGRTYLSALERGLKSPTLDKVQELADFVGVHPLSILALAYMQVESCSAQELQAKMSKGLEDLLI